MHTTIPSDEQLTCALQFELDELRYDLDPATRDRAQSESHRRLAAMLAQ